MTERYKTNGQTTLTASLNASETAVAVTSAAALRDSYTTGDTYRLLIDSEVMIVTAESGNTLTVTRGAENTTGATHSNGATVKQEITAGALDQIKLDTNFSGLYNGQSELAANYSMAGATGVYVDSGLSIALPNAGIYMITAASVGYFSKNGGTYLQLSAKLYNSTDAADASGASAFGYTENLVTNVATGMIRKKLTVAAAKTIKLYVVRDFDGSAPTTSILIGNAAGGQTTMDYVRRS